MKSMFTRQFVLMAGVILISFSILGASFISLSYRYTIEERQKMMQNNAAYIAQQASEIIAQSVSADGFTLRAAFFQPTIEAVSGVTDATVLLCIQNGQIIYASDDTGQPNPQLFGKFIPRTMVEAVHVTGHLSTLSDLNGLLPAPSYVVAEPIIVPQNGQWMMAGLVVVTTEDGRITEMWRGFSSIFFSTAIAVLLVAFVTSSLTSLKLVQPLQDMAHVVRRFGHGEHNVRIPLANRRDEVGELADAFNTMADSIAKSEERRSEFVANVSHELKTPMTTIAGFAEGILDGTIPPEKEREYLKTISSETRRLSRLVIRMLDLSRLQAGEDVTPQEQFDATEILLRVLVSLERKINQRVLDVDANLPEQPVKVWGDPDGITQVCYNLLDNAIKFSTPESILGVRVETRGTKVYIGIQNHGETIPESEIPFLFDRFHKADRSRSEDREGVGLGLYIVKTILNNHREDIYCTSHDGITEFVFTLTLV